jgi:hypothetical protein
MNQRGGRFPPQFLSKEQMEDSAMPDTEVDDDLDQQEELELQQLTDRFRLALARLVYMFLAGTPPTLQGVDLVQLRRAVEVIESLDLDDEDDDEDDEDEDDEE